jgi:NADH-quinone oxidoreductase subunit J
MSLSVALFAVLAAITGGSALMVVLTRHVVRAAVWLLFALVGVAGLYFLLGADFLGTAQLIIYVGGTLVLVVFGVMLTAQERLLRLRAAAWERVAVVLVGGSLLAVLTVTLSRGHWPAATPEGGQPLASVAQLGAALLGAPGAQPVAPLAGGPDSDAPKRSPSAYLLPFEAVSVHLLVVLIGAAYLARARRRKPLPLMPPEAAP